MALKIYGAVRTRAFRVLWLAEELGLDYQRIPLETGPADARRPDYLGVNPTGRLPAIDDDGFILWESLAINLYLARKHATGTLCPATLQAKPRRCSGACGQRTRSSARPMSGPFTAIACRPPSATWRLPTRCCKYSRLPTACSTRR